MKPTIEQLITMLSQAPARIVGSVEGAPPKRLITPQAPDEWSANDVLAHLRSCADVWGGCIETILTEDQPTIRAVNPRTWIKSTDYLTQDFRKSLRAFGMQRERLVERLSLLSMEEWSRKATITGAGRPLVRSVFDYAAWMASHERPHLKQIHRTVQGVG